MVAAPLAAAEPVQRLPREAHQPRRDRSLFDRDVLGSLDRDTGHITRPHSPALCGSRGVEPLPSLARRDHFSRSWRTSPRWAQRYASSPRARARERRTTTFYGTDHTSALAPGQGDVLSIEPIHPVNKSSLLDGSVLQFIFLVNLGATSEILGAWNHLTRHHIRAPHLGLLHLVSVHSYLRCDMAVSHLCAPSGTTGRPTTAQRANTAPY